MLIGIHGRNDFWGRQFTEQDYQVIREAKIELVKLMEYTKLNVVQRLRAENPSIQFLVRLYEEGQQPGPPAKFVKKHTGAIESFRPYTHLFEVLNEPNHIQEGWGPTLDQAGAFNRWFLETLPLLKARHPWAKFGFPAVSPTMLPNDPHLDFDWLEACRPAIEAADWLAVHCYWFDEGGLLHPAFGLRFTQYHERFPDKTFHITEFNGGPQLPPWTRAENYAQYYQEVAKYNYVASASSFIISSPDPQFHPIQWWNPGSHQLHPIAWRVGQIPRPLTPKVDSRPEYAVDYISHSTPEKMMESGTATVEVVMRNAGRRVWPADGTHMVRLGYHWHQVNGEPLSESLWTQHRSRLAYNVQPDHTAVVHIQLDAPRVPGKHLLKWDMVEEFVTWFAWQDVPTLDIPVEIIATHPPPAPPPTGQIRASASHNNVQQGFDNLQQALDHNPFTRWSTVARQRPGMWFQLDLGQVKTVAQLRLDNDQSPMDYPQGYVVKVSPDGQTWETVAEKTNNDKPVNIVFAPRPARFIRIEQTGHSDQWWWSIHNIYVSAEARPTARSSHNNVLVGADNVQQALDGDPNSRWSTRTLQQPGQWFEIDLNTTRTIKRLVLDNQKSPADYPRGYIIRLSEDRQNWIEAARNDHNTGPLDVSFGPHPTRFIHIEQTGSADRWWWSIHRVGIE